MPYSVPPPPPPPVIETRPVNQPESASATPSMPESQLFLDPEMGLPGSPITLATQPQPSLSSSLTANFPLSAPQFSSVPKTDAAELGSSAIALPYAAMFDTVTFSEALAIDIGAQPPRRSHPTDSRSPELRTRSASILAQDSTADEAAPAADSDAEPNSEEADVPVIVYPRGATPEPIWSNGAIDASGELFPPTQPTRPPADPIDLTADYQEFEPQRQVVTARGNVVLQLTDGVLRADRLWANLENRFVLAEGNVVFQRGGQTIAAERVEYNLLQGQGSLFDARGTLYLPTTGEDLAGIGTTDGTVSFDPVETLLEEGSITTVRGTGGITIGSGVGSDPTAIGSAVAAGGSVRRIRFQAEQLDFDAEGWTAQDIRLTNDPFSPPELELRGNSATLTRLTELEDELYVENPRLVFDQRFALPLLRSTYILRRGGEEQLTPFNIGYDGEERGGLFIERTFRVATVPPWSLSVTPQILAQRFLDNTDVSELSNFGLEVDLDGQFGPTTKVNANASFSGLDLENFDERVRASVRVLQLVGDHNLTLEYSYRDRLFNGSLGFQTVDSSLGAVLVSPAIPLGDTGIILTYQTSAQYVTAATDRVDLLGPAPTDNLISLGRFQGSATLSRGFTLWQGEALPPTPDAGLRFTPNPVVPNLGFYLIGRGTYTYYTSQDTQESLLGIIGISGTFGHFSRDFLDSTVFNLSYQTSFVGEGGSPFTFDRDVDQNVLSGGILQQIYGPFRLGFQTSINLDTGEAINTDYILEYSRRTYSVVLRFNPVQSSGFIGFRLNEFDWSGRAARFGGADIRQVESGVLEP